MGKSSPGANRPFSLGGKCTLSFSPSSQDDPQSRHLAPVQHRPRAGLFHRQVAGLGALENLVDVSRRAPKDIEDVRAGGQPTAGLGEVPRCSYIAGNRCFAARPVRRCFSALKSGDDTGMSVPIRSLAAASRRRLDVIGNAHLQARNLPAQRTGGRFNLRDRQPQVPATP